MGALLSLECRGVTRWGWTRLQPNNALFVTVVWVVRGRIQVLPKRVRIHMFNNACRGGQAVTNTFALVC